MKKRYCCLISSIFLMFLLFLFLVSAAGTEKWIECKSSCPTADNACPPAGTGNKCCKNNENLDVSGTDYCCISNIWSASSSDVCDGLDNDCNAATADGSGQTAPNCALQVGVCADSKQSCGSTSGWLACTSSNYVANNANYESTESKCDGLDNDCDGTIDEGCDDDNDDYCDSFMTRASPYSCSGTTQCCPTGGNDCNDVNININPGISENTNTLCSDGIDNNCNKDNDAALDNDATTGIDCKDLNCNNKVCGTQTIACTLNGNPSCNTATGDIYADTDTDKTCNKVCSSSVCGSCTAPCDRSLKTDCVNTCIGETAASNFAADAPVTDNNLCASGQTTCPSTTSADVCGAGNMLTEYYCSGNDAASSTYDCDNSDNTGLDNAPCGDAIDGCTTRDYSCTDNSDRDYCSYVTRDLDTDSSSCAAGGAATSWIATGEASAHGEYTAGQTAAACCGDDSNEKIITAGVGDTKCCSLTTKCIDLGGVCRDNVNENTNALCSDSIDNDCDGNIGCADSGCAGKTGPGGVTCCQTATVNANCGNDDCRIESCTSSNTCSYTNRLAGAADECSTCQACDAAGGNCAGITANDGKSCADDCTYCNAGTCTNRAQEATDECSTCQACDAAGGNCAGISAETGKNCISDCSDCVSGTCTAVTESNDGTCADDCTYCNAGTCTNRAQCAATECVAGSYCDSVGGNCQAPDSSSAVCLNCAPDQTAATWTWSPPNHQDAGKGYNSDLFNSNGAACPPTSCSQPPCTCYDASGSPINHKSALSTSACCGDDASEYYKPDYHGPECTNDVNDCVWSDGNAQAADTGNKEYWCYQHEWNECKVNADIGKKTGGVTCAGTSTTKKWTPNAQVLAENQYSCTDGLDNDGDTKIDCADSDCAGTIAGSVKDANNNPIGSAKIDVLRNAVVVHTAFANALGSYTINDNQDVICGSYDMIASFSGYVSSTKTTQLQPNENKQNVDFVLTKGTTCEADCTYAGDDLIHAECQGINNCNLCNFNCDFCNPQIAANSCNLAKPGWIRSYNDPAQPECQAAGCVIECGQGCPIAKVEIKAAVTCEEENLFKVTKLVMYKGKLAKLNIIVCG